MSLLVVEGVVVGGGEVVDVVVVVVVVVVFFLHCHIQGFHQHGSPRHDVTTTTHSEIGVVVVAVLVKSILTKQNKPKTKTNVKKTEDTFT